MLDWVNSYIGNPVNPALDGTIFSENVAPMTFIERFKSLIMTVYITWSGYHHMPIQNKYLEKYFGPNCLDVLELQKDLALVLLNYNSDMSGLRIFTPSVVPIAGVHIQEDNETLPNVS